MWFAENTLENAETFVRNTEHPIDDCETSKEMLLRILSSTDLQEKALDSHAKQMFYGTINNVLALTLLSHTEGGQVSAVSSAFAWNLEYRSPFREDSARKLPRAISPRKAFRAKLFFSIRLHTTRLRRFREDGRFMQQSR